MSRAATFTPTPNCWRKTMNTIGDKRIDPPYTGGPRLEACANCRRKFEPEEMATCDICSERLCQACNIIKPEHGYVMNLACLEKINEEHNRNITLDRLAQKAIQSGDVADLKEYLEARRLLE